MIKAIIVDAGSVLYLNNNGMGYVNPDLFEYIKSKQGEYIFGVISDTSLDLEDVMKKNGIDIFFNLVLTSGKTGLRKDEPAIYKMALDIINLKPVEVVYVDDTPAFVAAAASLGINTVLYNGNSDKNFGPYKEKIEQIIYQTK